jgi:hypothetical protein
LWKVFAVTMRFGFVSTYPPTQCGLATFTSSLMTAMIGRQDHVGYDDTASVIRLLESPGHPRGFDDPSPEVVGTMVAGDPKGAAAAAMLLSSCDVVVVQHEYGIFGGHDGDEVLSLLSQLSVPSIVVLHTVLTWGLIGPGKGIEWGIEAMGHLRGLRPEPQYVVAGQTHPKVREHAGEAYRDSLRDRIDRLGLESSVHLDGRYRNNSDLAALVRSAAVVLLPYDSTEQVTSGVLIEAVAAQRPVVATRFPHAVELLAGGAGILVPQRDPAAMAEALRAVLTKAGLAATMTRAAASQTAELLWPAVAQRYRDLAAELIRAEIAA